MSDYTEDEERFARALYGLDGNFYVDFIKEDKSTGTLRKLYDRATPTRLVPASKQFSDVLSPQQLQIALSYGKAFAVTQRRDLSDQLRQVYRFNLTRFVPDLRTGYRVEAETAVELERSSAKETTWKVKLDTRIASPEEQDLLGLTFQEVYSKGTGLTTVSTVEGVRIDPAPSKFVFTATGKKLLEFDVASIGSTLSRKQARKLAIGTLARLFAYMSMVRIVIAAASAMIATLKLSVPAGLIQNFEFNFDKVGWKISSAINDEDRVSLGLAYLDSYNNSIEGNLKLPDTISLYRVHVGDSIIAQVSKSERSKLNIYTMYQRLAENEYVTLQSIQQAESVVADFKKLVLQRLQLGDEVSSFDRKIREKLDSSRQKLDKYFDQSPDSRVKKDNTLDAMIAFSVFVHVLDALNDIPDKIVDVPEEMDALFKIARQRTDFYAERILRDFCALSYEEIKNCEDNSFQSRAIIRAIRRASNSAPAYYAGSIIALLSQSKETVVLLEANLSRQAVTVAVRDLVACTSKLEQETTIWSYLQEWVKLFKKPFMSFESIRGEIDKQSYPRQSLLLVPQTANEIAKDLLSDSSQAQFYEEQIRKFTLIAWEAVDTDLQSGTAQGLVNDKPAFEEIVKELKEDINGAAKTFLSEELKTGDKNPKEKKFDKNQIAESRVNFAASRLATVLRKVQLGQYDIPPANKSNSNTIQDTKNAAEARQRIVKVRVALKRAVFYAKEAREYFSGSADQLVDIDDDEDEDFEDFDIEVKRIFYAEEARQAENKQMADNIKKALKRAKDIKDRGQAAAFLAELQVKNIIETYELDLDSENYRRPVEDFAKDQQSQLRNIRGFYQRSSRVRRDDKNAPSQRNFLFNYAEAYCALMGASILAKEEVELAAVRGLPADQMDRPLSSIVEAERQLGQEVAKALLSVIKTREQSDEPVFREYFDLLVSHRESKDSRRPPIVSEELLKRFLTTGIGSVVTGNVDALLKTVAEYFTQYAPLPLVVFDNPLLQFSGLTDGQIKKAQKELIGFLGDNVNERTKELNIAEPFKQRIDDLMETFKSLTTGYKEDEQSPTGNQFVSLLTVYLRQSEDLFTLLKNNEPIDFTPEQANFVTELVRVEKSVVQYALQFADIRFTPGNRDIDFGLSSIIKETKDERQRKQSRRRRIVRKKDQENSDVIPTSNLLVGVLEDMQVDSPQSYAKDPNKRDNYKNILEVIAVDIAKNIVEEKGEDYLVLDLEEGYERKSLLLFNQLLENKQIDFSDGPLEDILLRDDFNRMIETYEQGQKISQIDKELELLNESILTATEKRELEPSVRAEYVNELGNLQDEITTARIDLELAWDSRNKQLKSSTYGTEDLQIFFVLYDFWKDQAADVLDQIIKIRNGAGTNRTLTQSEAAQKRTNGTLQALTQRTKQLQAQLDRSLQSIRKTADDALASGKGADKIAKALDSLESKIQEVEGRDQTLEERYKDLLTTLEGQGEDTGLTKQVSALTNQFRVNESRLKDFVKKFEELETKIYAAENSKEDLLSRYNEAVRLIEQQKPETEAISSATTDLEKKLTSTTKTIDRIDNVIKKAEKGISGVNKLESAVAKLEGKVEADLQATENKVVTLDNRVNDLGDKLATNFDSLNSKKTQIDQYNKTVIEKTSTYNTTNSVLSVLSGNLAKLETKLSAQETALGRSERRLDSANDRAGTLETNFNRLKQRFDEAKKPDDLQTFESDARDAEEDTKRILQNVSAVVRRTTDTVSSINKLKLEAQERKENASKALSQTKLAESALSNTETQIALLLTGKKVPSEALESLAKRANLVLEAVATKLQELAVPVADQSSQTSRKRRSTTTTTGTPGLLPPDGGTPTGGSLRDAFLVEARTTARQVQALFKGIETTLKTLASSVSEENPEKASGALTILKRRADTLENELKDLERRYTDPSNLRQRINKVTETLDSWRTEILQAEPSETVAEFTEKLLKTEEAIGQASGQIDAQVRTVTQNKANLDRKNASAQQTIESIGKAANAIKTKFGVKTIQRLQNVIADVEGKRIAVDYLNTYVQQILEGSKQESGDAQSLLQAYESLSGQPEQILGSLSEIYNALIALQETAVEAQETVTDLSSDENVKKRKDNIEDETQKAERRGQDRARKVVSTVRDQQETTPMDDNDTEAEEGRTTMDDNDNGTDGNGAGPGQRSKKRKIVLDRTQEDAKRSRTLDIDYVPNVNSQQRKAECATALLNILAKDADITERRSFARAIAAIKEKYDIPTEIIEKLKVVKEEGEDSSSTSVFIVLASYTYVFRVFGKTVTSTEENKTFDIYSLLLPYMVSDLAIMTIEKIWDQNDELTTFENFVRDVLGRELVEGAEEPDRRAASFAEQHLKVQFKRYQDEREDRSKAKKRLLVNPIGVEWPRDASFYMDGVLEALFNNQKTVLYSDKDGNFRITALPKSAEKQQSEESGNARKDQTTESSTRTTTGGKRSRAESKFKSYLELDALNSDDSSSEDSSDTAKLISEDYWRADDSQPGGLIHV